jgi:hypothetical protein
MLEIQTMARRQTRMSLKQIKEAEDCAATFTRNTNGHGYKVYQFSRTRMPTDAHGLIAKIMSGAW